MADFKDVIGHESVILHLQNSIRQGRISHAYLFSGDDGSGKHLLAESFAKTLLCKEEGIIACDSCKDCRQFASGNHPDFHRITREKASLSVKEIREQVTEDVQVKPYSGKYKIYLIGEAEKMTEEAQNALLKTIEEPPPYAVFLLLVKNPEQLLQTVLSRCIALPLYPVPKDKIKQFLMTKKGIAEPLAEGAAAFSGGLVGRALQFVESESFVQKRNETIHLLKYIDEMNMGELMDGVRLISGDKEAAPQFFELVLIWFRDVLMFKATQNPNMLLYADEFETIASQAQKRTYENLQEIVNEIEICKQRLKANVNFENSLELLLLKMKEVI